MQRFCCATNVIDGALRRELKQFVRRQPTATLLEARAEAIRWKREGLPGANRGRSHSVPLVLGLQYGVQGGPQVVTGSQVSELSEMREMLKLQQEQHLLKAFLVSRTLSCAVAPPRVAP